MPILSASAAETNCNFVRHDRANVSICLCLSMNVYAYIFLDAFSDVTDRCDFDDFVLDFSCSKRFFSLSVPASKSFLFELCFFLFDIVDD